ncbi:hypothetical protein Y032_0452g1703 [Ancylostoma ceylanicum]|uniref:Uncharacterized protein n=1 Tax=Ancylostoma ceylanicum TaxID=53326 RepID=A0A016WYK1_9BILA|nr:hypothetical protein Y032_0452g1703 [Ancylostoma ceylanicum]
MNQNEPAIEEIMIVEMIRIDCHVDRLERCQTELIAPTLEDVPKMNWRFLLLPLTLLFSYLTGQSFPPFQREFHRRYELEDDALCASTHSLSGMVVYTFSRFDLFSAPIVHVVLEIRDTNQKGLEAVYKDVDELFFKYGENHGIYFDETTLQREAESDSQGLYKFKYGMRGVDCTELQDWFLNLEQDKDTTKQRGQGGTFIEIAHVDCGKFSFSICMAKSCPKDTFPNFVEKEES